jgi:hypothetical protein
VRKAADFDEVLGVTPSATADELKAAYRELARRHHPDRARTYLQKIAATRRMQAINAAYAILRDAQRRAAYDAERSAPLEKPGLWVRRAAGAPPSDEPGPPTGREAGQGSGRKAKPWPGGYGAPPIMALGMVVVGAVISLFVSGRSHWSVAVLFLLAELAYCSWTDCIDD